MVTAEFNPLAPGVLADPYPMYRALLQHNPVSWSDMMEMWILTRYADVDFVLTHPAMSADRANARNRFAEMQQAQQLSFGRKCLAPGRRSCQAQPGTLPFDYSTIRYQRVDGGVR